VIILEHEQELDQGFDFYAPQSIMTNEGKRVIMDWMNMWERNYPLHELGHGWNGSMTLPRELSLENGKLLQKPYQKIEKYQQNKVEFNHFEINGKYEDGSLNGRCQQIEVEFEMKDPINLKHIQAIFIIHYDFKLAMVMFFCSCHNGFFRVEVPFSINTRSY
jgi:sucrose-6-phosphate hydrolase SacC (GH32 family)